VVFHPDRRTKETDNSVTFVFIYSPAISQDYVAHFGQVKVKQVYQYFRTVLAVLILKLRRNGRKALYVRKNGCHLSFFASQF